MADFTIPKGKPYEFTVRVVAKDSFLAQDLTGSLSTFELIDIDTGCVYDTAHIGTVQGAASDGVVKFSLDSEYTSGLTIARGDKVDGYYSKASYQGVITITFNDSTIEDRVSIINKVYIVPTSCIA
jgi:hypothetical protein